MYHFFVSHFFLSSDLLISGGTDYPSGYLGDGSVVLPRLHESRTAEEPGGIVTLA